MIFSDLSNEGEPVKFVRSAVRLFLLILVFGAATANASLVRFEFTGVVSGSKYIDGPNAGMAVPGVPTVGTAISGAYVFDTSVQDSYPGSTYGSFHYAVKTWDSWIGDLAYHFNLSGGGFSRIDTEDGSGSGGMLRDRYSAYVRQMSGTGRGLTGPSLGNYSPTFIQLFVFDFEGDPNPDLLENDSMPTAPPNLSLALSTVTDLDGKVRVFGHAR